MKQKLVYSESYEEFENKYERRDHMVGNSMWEFEFCPKYRYKMFGKLKYRNLVEACIRRSAFSHKIKILEIEVMPNHVHVVAGLPGTMSPSKAMQLLKGGSAFLFFKNHEKARLRYPKGHLWSRGKFWASVGFVQVEQVREYVKNQRAHHGLGSPTL